MKEREQIDYWGNWKASGAAKSSVLRYILWNNANLFPTDVTFKVGHVMCVSLPVGLFHQSNVLVLLLFYTLKNVCSLRSLSRRKRSPDLGLEKS